MNTQPLGRIPHTRAQSVIDNPICSSGGTAKLMGRLAIVLIALSTLTLPGFVYAAGRVFFDNFESYSVGILPTTNWSSDSLLGNPMPRVVSSSADGIKGPRSGAKMLRTNHQNGLIYESADTPTISYNSEIFYRFWLRADQNHDGSASTGAKYLRFYIFRTGPIHWIDKFVAYHKANGSQGYTNSGQFGFDSDPQNTYFGNAPGDVSDRWSDWSKIEMYFNTTTGTFKCWNNGILVTNVTGRNLGGLKATSIHLVSNGDGMDNLNYMYFDDIEIFSDTGTGATGSMSNATIQQGSPMPVVQNLRVVQ